MAWARPASIAIAALASSRTSRATRVSGVTVVTKALGELFLSELLGFVKPDHDLFRAK